MPTYLCHGFRWQRRSVRVYVILQNLDDASPEWIIPAKSSQSILKSFYEVFEFLPYCSPKRGRYTPSRETDSDDDSRILHYANGTPKDRSQSRGRGRSQSQSTHQSRSHSRATPQQLLPRPSTAADESSSTASASSEDDFSAQSWSAIKLLEEYDPHDLTAVSRPYAYVADYAVRIDLSCSIVDEIARYEQQQLQSAHPAVSIPSSSSNLPAQSSPGWFEELRDQLQSGEEIRWYVVVNNDEVRDWADERSESATSSRPPEQGYQHQPLQQYQQHQPQHQIQYQPQPGRPMPSREQKQHHAQYMHQQLIFAGGDREKEQPQPAAWNDLEQQRGRQQQQPQQQLVFERSDQQRKYDEEKRQQQLLFEKKKAEQQRKQEEEKRQQQQQLLFERSQQQQRRREQEQEQQQQRLAWKELELRKAQQRERERQQQQQREREKEKEQDRKREEEKQRLLRLRDQKPPPPPPPQINGAADPAGKPPMVPEKDYFPSFPRPPTANANAKANAKVPPPLRPKMSIDTGRPKTAGSIGGGLRRLFGRTKVQVDGVYSP